MSDEKQGNPWAQWIGGLGQIGQGATGEVFRSWEGWLSGQLDRFMRSEAFRLQIGRAIETSESVRAHLQQIAEQALGSLPSGDSSDTAARLEAAEQRLDALVDRIEAMERKLGA